MQLATDLGWWTGSRSDDTISDVHRPLYLLDVHWSDYNWIAHMAVARAERPALCVVPDILTPAQLPAVLAMAEDIAPYCSSILFVPKCDVIESLPRCIGGIPTLLGYSVQSRYGQTNLPVWCFAGWPVHLLGGTPLRQLTAARYMDVVSADGNMWQKLANRGIIIDHRGRGTQYWEAHNGEADLPTRALRHSLTNIPIAWARAGFTVEPNPAGQVRAILAALAPEFGPQVST